MGGGAEGEGNRSSSPCGSDVGEGATCGDMLLTIHTICLFTYILVNLSSTAASTVLETLVSVLFFMKDEEERDCDI